ncbi:hypothetical protein BU600_04395 [Staphylococcus arlettae]|uniref:hypothetical protein n=1 Tax=Staphylococcus arlettae TaxID=29378 RepID=UPI000D1B281B|nr:hypothetical protein [Staphylococcus arlettae]PTH60465.1 hypothetical protein BU599_05045 [Staphylococcus arlettae]RIM70581.1 hypothetical protein BU600_04395 [Staphylococcus arlettae]RIM74660.1 hypothetical protein BU594_00390 [Staphylococcus arlettae]
MATDKQVKYVQLLQEQCDIGGYEEHEIKAMNHNEISNVVNEIKKAIAEEELYNECMSYGLPNQ